MGFFSLTEPILEFVLERGLNSGDNGSNMQRSTATIVRAAGYAYEPDGETTNACMTFPERPTTPHEVRKYRRSYFAEPGVRVSGTALNRARRPSPPRAPPPPLRLLAVCE